MRYPLANDVNGNPLEVPEAAVAWRVRRASGRPGRPQNVYDPETGRQLEVPLDATVDDLRECGCGPGRYRLEAVDGDSRAIAGIVAFTELVPDAEVRSEPAEVLAPMERLLETIEKQSDTLCRALEAMANAFGPVRPAQVSLGEPHAGEEEVRSDQI